MKYSEFKKSIIDLDKNFEADSIDNDYYVRIYLNDFNSYITVSKTRLYSIGVNATCFDEPTFKALKLAVELAETPLEER